MAYMNQELKSKLSPTIKSVLKKYGMAGTLSIKNHSTLRLTITKGKLDIIDNHLKKLETSPYTNKSIDFTQMRDNISTFGLTVNQYWIIDRYTGTVLNFLKEIVESMNAGNHDNSDIMTDYFDVGWYIDIKIGDYKKPYQLIK